MGSFFCDLLQRHHTVAIYDPDPERLLFTFGCRRFSSLQEVDAFAPEMALNAAPVRHTLDAFAQMLPHLPKECVLADIASVKTGLPEFYASCGHPFVSTHPMFGPTFASLSNLANENAIIITESCPQGAAFFRELYTSLRLHIAEYSFAEHDRVMAYSLSIPFVSTLVFGSCMEPQEAPGTTFKRHKAIADGLMSEDPYLLSEILFNPNTSQQVANISRSLSQLQDIISRRDLPALMAFLDDVRSRLK